MRIDIEMSKDIANRRVVIGLSGGVDSSVAAYLLKEQGYEVIGLFMRNWHDTTGTLEGDCPWEDDQTFAELVAKKLDIPFHYVDLSKQYREKVIDYMFAEYEKGRTPNPDVLCNREIKFDVFLDEALKLGADYVATGHYCRKEEFVNDSGERVYRLLAGEDKGKDQSYFLCQLSQEQLSRSLFPIGEMQKSDVRKVAEEQKLATAKRKDSQGICFVGKVDLPTFLQQQLSTKKGDIVEIPSDWSGFRSRIEDKLSDSCTFEMLSEPYHYSREDGEKVGEHSGAHFYTIGQRRGLNVGGKPEPLFVIAIDVDENIVYVGQGQEHPGLFRRALNVGEEEMHWIRPDLELEVGESQEFDVRIRYRQPLQRARLFVEDNGSYIVFKEPQRGITAGQFAAWYSEEELVGSGVINA